MPTLTTPLQTSRLILRAPVSDDLDDVHAYQRLPEVARYLYRPPRSREWCAESIAATRADTAWATEGDSATLLVLRRDLPGAIGEVVLTLADLRASQWEVGWILHSRHTGRGYAVEAAAAAVAAAFDRLGAHRVFARLDVENAASIRLCERLGMRREAHLVENDLNQDGRWGSEYVYAVLARDLRRDCPSPGTDAVLGARAT